MTAKLRKNRTLRQHLREWRRAIIIAVVVVAVIKGFFFDLCVVSSTSMEKELLPGDFVVVNKLAYGPRLPITPLAVPMTHQTLPFVGLASYTTIMQLPYMRFPGYSEVRNGDVLVFNYPLDANHPVDHRTYYIKRCIGLPGQTVELASGRTFVDDHELARPANGQQNYRVEVDNASFSSEVLQRYNITEGGPTHHRNVLELSLTDSALAGLQAEASVTDVLALYHPHGLGDAVTFPVGGNHGWNRDNWGPLVVPAQGDSVRLSAQTLPLYKRIITHYEGHALQTEDTLIFIDGKPATHYTFEMDYFFVLGDNRHQSADSRSWGFVPENHLVGRAGSVLFSLDNSGGGIRWNRFFESISSL